MRCREPHHEDRRTLSLRGDPLRGRCRSDRTRDLPLHRLPDALRLRVSHHHFRRCGRFRAPDGAPKSYVKMAESGSKRRHAFCGTCGTPILPVRQTPPGAIRCGLEPLPSAPPCRPAGKAGDARPWCGWIGWPPCPAAKKAESPRKPAKRRFTPQQRYAIELHVGVLDRSAYASGP